MARTQASPASNPPLPAGACGLRVVLLIDISASIPNAGAENPGFVRSGAKTFVDALQASPSSVSVVTFANNAATEVADAKLDDSSGRRRTVQAIAGIQFDSGFGATAGTNWEAGFRATRRFARPDLVVLVSDGNPNRYGVAVDRLPSSDSPDFDPRALNAAVAEADALRQAGTRVVAVGVGEVREESLQAVSGPARGSDWFIGDFPALARSLAEVATAACGSRFVVRAEVDRAPLPGWRFSLREQGRTQEGTAGPDGSLAFTRAAQSGPGALTVTALSRRDGVDLATVRCLRNDEPVPVRPDLQRAAVSVDIAPAQVLVCSFDYERDPGDGVDPGPPGDVLDERGTGLGEILDEALEAISDGLDRLGIRNTLDDLGEALDDLCEAVCRPLGKSLQALDVFFQWRKDNGRDDLNRVERVLRMAIRVAGSNLGASAGATAGAAMCAPLAPPAGSIICGAAGIFVGSKFGEEIADAIVGFLDGFGGNLPDLPNLPNLPDLPDLPDLPGPLPNLPNLPDLPDLPNLPDLPDLPNPFDIF